MWLAEVTETEKSKDLSKDMQLTNGQLSSISDWFPGREQALMVHPDSPLSAEAAPHAQALAGRGPGGTWHTRPGLCKAHPREVQAAGQGSEKHGNRPRASDAAGLVPQAGKQAARK